MCIVPAQGMVRCGISRTLHARLDNIKRVNEERGYRAGRKAGDGLDEGGGEALMISRHRSENDSAGAFAYVHIVAFRGL